MARMIIIAGDEGIEAAGERINGRRVVLFFVVGEDDAVAAVELRGCDDAEVLGYES